LGITPPPEEPKKKEAPSPIDIKEARLNGIQKQVTETRNANLNAVPQDKTKNYYYEDESSYREESVLEGSDFNSIGGAGGAAPRRGRPQNDRSSGPNARAQNYSQGRR